ncbi:MAG TPA: NUDIX hydrolase [Gaiellaceae bacterium]|nr:NUDIX hydrolase [Gaiellaceae bacterium]
MHVTEAVLESLQERYGAAERLRWEGEVSRQEFALAGSSPERRHDVTFFVFDARERLALIQKPSYPPDVWRPPGGGVRPEERFEDGVQREAVEELGVEIALERFLVSTEATFRCGDEMIEWRTLVFSARTDADALDPQDTREIAAARWGTTAELAGPLRAAMLETGRALWRYRVSLHDATLSVLARSGV